MAMRLFLALLAVLGVMDELQKQQVKRVGLLVKPAK